MTDDTTEPTSANDPLRLDRCPDCGYLLTGLPEQGLCPECGFAYDPEMIVLYGWAGAFGSAYAWTARSPALLWVQIATLILALFAAWFCLRMGRPLDALLVMVVVPACVGWSLFKWFTVHKDSLLPVQLRLLPQGIGQRTGFGRVRLVPWQQVVALNIYWRGGRRYLVGAEHSLPRRFLRGRPVIDFALDMDTHDMERFLPRIGRWCAKISIWDMRNEPLARRMEDLERLCHGQQGPHFHGRNDRAWRYD